MKMSEVIRRVNDGMMLYRFSRFGNTFAVLSEKAFTPQELEGTAQGYVKPKGRLLWRKACRPEHKVFGR